MKFKFILYYLFSGLLALFIAILLMFFLLQFSTINIASKKNKLLEEYIENIKFGSGKMPILCPATAIQYSKKYNIEFNKFFPLGSIPNGQFLQNKKDIINLDKFGFRNSNNIWESKDINTLYLGDSIVFSSDINNGKVFTDIINNKDITVANLGCGGNGLFTSLALAKQVLHTYKVENLVIFINLQNDLTKDTSREGDSGIYKSYINNNKFNSIFSDQKNYEKSVKGFMINVLKFEREINKKKSSIRFLINFDNFIKFLSFIKDKIANSFTEDYIINENIEPIDKHAETQVTSSDWLYFNSFMNGIKRISNKYNTKITFIIIPSKYRINSPEVSIARSVIKYDMVKNMILTNIIAHIFSVKSIDNKYEIIEDFKFDIIDLTNIIMKENNKNNIIFDGHFSNDGHKFLADYLLKNINLKDTDHYKKIILYNSLNVYNMNTHTNYNKGFEGNNINETQYIDWIKSLKFFLKNNSYNEFLLAPFFSYSFHNDRCNDILDITNNLLNNIENARLVLLYGGICELKNINNKDIKIFIDKIEKALYLNVEDIAPYLALALSEQLETLKEIR